MATNPGLERPAAQDAEIAQYRALSTASLVGLFFGLLAWVALLDRWGWFVPILGIIFSGLGLWRVTRHADAMIGRKAALWGLWLSVVFAVAAPTHWFGYRRMVRREATQFATEWFEYLRNDKPLEIHQLSWHPKHRLPLDETLVDAYREDRDELKKARKYSAGPLISRLLSLGPKAEARYYTTVSEERGRRAMVLHEIFSVTFEEDGRRKTFFVGLLMDRLPLGNGKYSWRVIDTEYGPRVVPPEFRGKCRMKNDE